MEPYSPQPDGEEEEWQRWRAERARRREERARQEKVIQEGLGESKGAVLNRLLVFPIAIGVVNFVIFESISLFAGGIAENGKAEGDRFYVGDHGRHAEVSQEFFDYSLVHGRWTFRFFLVSAGSGLLLGLRKAKQEKDRERLARRRMRSGFKMAYQMEPVQGPGRMIGHNLRLVLFSVATAVFLVAWIVGLYRARFEGARSLYPTWFFFAVTFAFFLYNELREWRG